MVKIFLILLAGLNLLFVSMPALRAQSLEENTVIAALALNIVRFTTWPPDALTKTADAIDFCVVGDNVVQQSFISIDDKAIGNRKIHVVNLTRLRNFEQCQVLYISDMKQNVLLQVFAEIKSLPILTIGQGSDFALTGGMVGLENIDEKITMNVNLTVVRDSNLNISARLLKLAKVSGG